MSSIKATAVTMGRPSPGSLTRGGAYRWRGIPGWRPDHPGLRDDSGWQEPRGHAAARREARERNLAVFTAARLAGKDVPRAGEAAGVTRKTARRYEAERLARAAAAQAPEAP